MFVRQVKRKCSVRGCKCTDSFAISRTREIGNTVIICKSCLGKALGAIDEIDPSTKSNIPKAERTEAPALFFNAAALGIPTEPVLDDEPVLEQDLEQEQEAVSDDVDSIPDDVDSVPDDVDDVPASTDYTCPRCGKVFNSEKGLKSHLRYCKAPTDDAQ